MPIEIQPLTEADVPTKCRIELDAFRSHPRIPMMWPRGYTADLYAFKESGDVDSLQDAKIKMLKAVDTTTGEFLGSAEWTFALDIDEAGASKKTPTREDAPPPANWPEAGNWPMRRFYMINIERLMKQHLDRTPYIMLNYLTVATHAQGQGIGSKLVAWGIEEADRRGVAMALESTPAGYPLYCKYGFRQVAVTNADMRDFGWTESYDETIAVRTFMIRDAR